MTTNVEKVPMYELKYPTQEQHRVIIFPDTPYHHALAQKLAAAQHNALVPCSNEELALLAEFFVWPR